MAPLEAAVNNPARNPFRASLADLLIFFPGYVLLAGGLFILAARCSRARRWQYRPACLGVALVPVLAVVDEVENVWLQTALCEVKSGAPERAAASVATMHDAYVVKNFLMRAGLAILFLRAVLLGGRKGVDRWRGQEVR